MVINEVMAWFQSLEKFLDVRRLGLWQRRVNQVAGIDIGGSSVKVVQLRKEKGRAILETYGEIAIGPYRDLSVGQASVLPPDKLVEVVNDLFQEANVTTRTVSLSIPVSASLLAVISIPRVEEELLQKVVPIEARKYIPVPIGEVALDWWVIPSSALRGEAEGREQRLEVLLVAIHHSVINQYRDIAQAAGLNVAFFELETFSTIRSIFGGETAPTAIIDLGAASTKMAIVDYGIVRLSHTIGKGSQDVTVAIARELGVEFARAEEIKRRVGLVERLQAGRDIAPTVSNVMEYIFLEANKAVVSYQEKQRRAINKIILIGGGALLKGLLPLAGRSFEVPVEVGKPFEKTETPAFLEEILREAGPGFSVAIGLALRHLQTLDQ